MKYCLKIFSILIILFKISVFNASAQDSLENTLDYVSITQGSLSVMGYTISETFRPMTHFKENDLELTLNTIYSKYDIITKNEYESCYGENLNSYSFGLIINYGINEDFFLNAVSSYANVDGNIEMGLMKNPRFKFTSNVYSFLSGIGYDIMSNEKWSVPILVGLGVVKISSKGEQLAEPIIPEYITTGTIDQYLFKTYFSAAVSYKFSLFESTFKATPYLFLMIGLNRPETKGEITGYTSATPVIGRFNIGDTNTKTGGDPQAFFPGFKFDYITDSNWSVSISVSGFILNSIDWYNETFLAGLKAKTYSLGISYNI